MRRRSRTPVLLTLASLLLPFGGTPLNADDELEPCTASQLGDDYIAQLRTIRINEIEQDCSENDNENPNDWVELYNSGDAAIDISGWRVLSVEPAYACQNTVGSADWKRATIPAETVLQPGDYFIATGSGNWLENTITRVCLLATIGESETVLVDVAHQCGDGIVNPYGTFFYGDPDDGEQDQELTWHRTPDGGSAAWRKLIATPGLTNSKPASVVLGGFCLDLSSGQQSSSVELVNWQEDDLDLEGKTLRYWDATPGYAPEGAYIVTLPSHVIPAKDSVRVYLGRAPDQAAGIGLGSRELGWSLGMPSVFELRGEWDRSIAYASYWTDCALSLILQLLPQEAIE